MSTARTKTINALENVIAESAVLLNKALVLNLLIRSAGLPLPQLDVTALYQTQSFAEAMLLEMELRAGYPRAAA